MPIHYTIKGQRAIPPIPKSTRTRNTQHHSPEPPTKRFLHKRTHKYRCSAHSWPTQTPLQRRSPDSTLLKPHPELLVIQPLQQSPLYRAERRTTSYRLKDSTTSTRPQRTTHSPKRQRRQPNSTNHSTHRNETNPHLQPTPQSYRRRRPALRSTLRPQPRGRRRQPANTPSSPSRRPAH